MTPAKDRRVTRSLDWKLPSLIAGIVLAVVLVYCWSAYREVRATAIASAKERLTDLAREIAPGSGAGTPGRLRMLASSSEIQRAIATGVVRDSTAGLLRRGVPGIDSAVRRVELVNASGQAILAIGDTTSPADQSRLSETFTAVTHTDSVRRSALFVHGGRVVAWTVYPVLVQREFIGAIAEERWVAAAPRAEQQVRELTGQDISIWFANPSGDVWTNIRGLPVEPPVDIGAVRDTFAVRGRDGGRLYGARASVAGAAWSVVLTIPERAILANSRTFLDRMVAFGLVLILIGTIAGWRVSRHVTRPLRVVIAAADELSAGDFSARVQVTRSDELGLLGSRFNAMADRIGESHGELARRVELSSSLAAEVHSRNEQLRLSRDETLRAVRGVQRLQSVTAALARAVDLDAVARVTLREGRVAADAAAGAIYALNDNDTELELVLADGYVGMGTTAPPRVSIHALLPVAEVATHGAPVFLESAAHWVARYGAESAPPPDTEGSWAVLPLISRGHTVGAWHICFDRARAFDSATRSLLLAIAQQCAQSLDRAQSFDAAVEARRGAEEAQHSAQSANSAKSAFLAMMSHELRTPLNAIGGYAELLAMGVRGPVSALQSADLGRIQRNQKHLLALINNILNLSRIEAGQLVMRLEDVSIDDVMAETEALIAPQVALKGIHYDVVAKEPGMIARADAEKLQQVILNLISNAIRFTEAGGTVRLSSTAGPGTVRISVADTGVGIPHDQRESIFEPFVQLDNGLTRRNDGTGLGLAISRELTVAMGGTISVASGPICGSVFTVELPRVVGSMSKAGDAFSTPAEKRMAVGAA